MANQIMLKIVTPEGIFIDDKLVDIVNLQTVDGDIGVLYNHAPIISTLKISVVSYAINGAHTYIHVHRGLVLISQKQVKIITERLYLVDEQGIRLDDKPLEAN
ncbi:F0F1 ATP synthase subunit epsilon [Spiroplasma endosymbiont of Labia minor]|uniref:FoF1 ATP synthase subunit delta/epsilon n=1 Tax=Spiroplasma endosymbiont of Labia minor TaxID=3066305 RepID=UPI0030CFF7FA